MPQIPTFTAGGSVQVGAPVAVASPGDFGAGIGQAMQELGGAVGRAAAGVQAYADQKEKEEIANGVANFDYSKRDLERRTAAAPGAEGFYRDTGPDYDKAVSDYVNTITNDRVRNEVRIRLTAQKPAVMEGAARYETQSSYEKGRNDANSGLATSLNKIRTDYGSYDAAVRDGEAVIDARPGLSGMDKATMKQKFSQDAAAARFDSRIGLAKSTEELDAVQREMESDAWRSKFDPAEYDRKQKEIDAERKAIQAGTKAEATATVQALNARANDPSLPIPKEELDAAEPVILQSGSPSLMRQYMEIRAKQDIYAREGKLPPGEVQARVNATAAKQSKSTDAENYAMQHYIKRGLSPAAAAGIVGNLTWESGGLNPNAINPRDGRDGSDSIGIAQWNSERAKALKAYAAARGKDWNDFDTQLDFVLDEADAQSAPWVQRTLAAKTPEEAASAFVGFERPAGWSEADPTKADGYANRVNAAKRLAGSAGGVTAKDYAENQARADILAKQKTAFGENGDMMTYANNTRQVSIQQLDNPESFALRGRQALNVADRNGVPEQNATPLTQAEVTQFSQTTRNGTAAEQVSLMKDIALMPPSMARAAYRQLGQSDRVFEYTAGLANNGGEDVATAVMQGRQRFREDKQLASAVKDADINTAFAASTGDALNALDPAVKQAILEAAKFHYVETYAKYGVNSAAIDATAFNQSVNAVLGGRKSAVRVDQVNGAATVLPQGVSADVMEDALDNMTPQDYVRFSVTGSPPVYSDGGLATPEEIASSGKFRAIGGGKYEIEMERGYLLVAPRRNGEVGRRYVFTADPAFLAQKARPGEYKGDTLRGGYQSRAGAYGSAGGE